MIPKKMKYNLHKTCVMACAPSEDSDKPDHPRSLISLHCVLNEWLRSQTFFMQTAKTLIRLYGSQGWSESSLGAFAILNISETCLYNVDPLHPHFYTSSHFYTVKLGFTGVYIIFLISAQKHRLWVLVSFEAVLTSTHNLCFEQKCEKYQNIYLKICIFFCGKISIYMNRLVFVMRFCHALALICSILFCALSRFLFTPIYSLEEEIASRFARHLAIFGFWGFSSCDLPLAFPELVSYFFQLHRRASHIGIVPIKSTYKH